MPTILSEPVLTLALDNLHKLRDVDCDSLCSMWAVFTKCKENLLNGQRLENLSWRLWFRQASSERKLVTRCPSELNNGSKYDASREGCSKSAPTPGSDLVKVFNSLPRQLSSASIHKLIDSVSPNSESINNDSKPLSSTFKSNLEKSFVEQAELFIVKDSALPKVEDVDIVESETNEQIISTLPDTTSTVAVEMIPIEDKKRKIFFIAESLEEEEYTALAYEKSKNSRTVMDLQALSRFPKDSSLEFSESNESESILDEEDWESIASSYQSTPLSDSDCFFEKINVPKHVSQCELPKPSLLSTLFQKRTSTPIPHSKPSLFRGLCTLNTLEKEHEQDPLAKELSSSLHQNVLWQRQQHDHLCRPFHKESSMTGLSTKHEYNYAASPGYYGVGW
ncbi:hypothetical protein K7432_007458 [Basidiobolus ranarum]|uniref:Nitrogen regulatory protein areA GATA-like domain-containing protein n=1 Tax=Basidiobolus ranarum TaxID=34480 RepID=A0ABR2WTJ9_9FUNG